ncbi:MAG: hypothetical protein JO022_18040 [Acidobacteriaceae bacterium]|nr:hypothetical protein [Acidobacteriaceae bacterium]
MSLDTRSKIITEQKAAALVQNRPVKLVSGHFDPLLPQHVRELRRAAAADELLIVTVTNPPDPLLPPRARAELVAALAAVDYVIMSDAPSVQEDSAFTVKFIDLVMERHSRLST